MKRLAGACLVLGLLFTALHAAPMAYDVGYAARGDSIVCRYCVSDVPAGALLTVEQETGDGSVVLAEKRYSAPVSGTVADSLVFHARDFVQDDAALWLDAGGRLYTEMVYIPAGRYHVIESPQRIAQYSLRGYWISAREVSNRQYERFMQDDGYETEQYWMIEGELMKDPGIGWKYQGSRPITKPYAWDFGSSPWYAQAGYSGDNAPVTGVTWFEAYAFCTYMNAQLPTYEQLASRLPGDVTLGVCCTDSRVTRVDGGAGEWTRSGIDPTGISCGGCNEMALLENCDEKTSLYPLVRHTCPLYRNNLLGFRYVVQDCD